MMPIAHAQHDGQHGSGQDELERRGYGVTQNGGHFLVLQVEAQVAAATGDEAARRSLEPDEVLPQERLVEVERIDPCGDQPVLVRCGDLGEVSQRIWPAVMSANIKKLASRRMPSDATTRRAMYEVTTGTSLASQLPPAGKH